MPNRAGREFARGIEIPYEPDHVLSPEVVYRHDTADAIYYPTEQDEWVRVTFEELDSIRACRGEYLPYPSDDPPGRRSWVYIVENSRWLRERHAYEAEHYRGCYELGGDVDEMLTDYDHYLFQFHDEFVEAIAAGIWLEKNPVPAEDDDVSNTHPLARLTRESALIQRHPLDDREYELWRNPRPLEEILWGARYCSQPLCEFIMDPLGFVCRVELRIRQEAPRMILRDAIGRREAAYEGVTALDEARKMGEAVLREVITQHRAGGLEE